MTVRCPSCRADLDILPLGASENVVDSVSCLGCKREFSSYRGVVDLRGETPPTCWTSALARPEQEIVRELAQGFEEMDLAELATLYARSHALPATAVEGMRGYWLEAVDREAWTITYMGFCAQRYAGRALRGERALDAGSGSGGAIAHLASRFDQVAGVDPDLPALMLAARRAISLGLGARVFLVAGMLEQDLWPTGAFDAVKCTDVIEHVADPQQAARVMAGAIEGRGIAFVLTPNRWSLLTREPHVGLWGVQLLPLPVADAWVKRKLGVRYRDVATLLSSRALARMLRRAGDHTVHMVPIEDKHLNPGSVRGRRLKAAFAHAPLRWASRLVRPIQPTLEAICVASEAPLRSSPG